MALVMNRSAGSLNTVMTKMFIKKEKKQGFAAFIKWLIPALQNSKQRPHISIQHLKQLHLLLQELHLFLQTNQKFPIEKKSSSWDLILTVSARELNSITAVYTD